MKRSWRRARQTTSQEPQSRPAEMVLRLLVRKHVRNWSYQVLEREVRPNLVYRDFTKMGAGKMPDAKTMGRWGLAVGPAVIEQVHARLIKIAQERGVVSGRRMSLDTRPCGIVTKIVNFAPESS